MTLFKPAETRRRCARSSLGRPPRSRPLEIVGGGSKQSLGRPLQVAHTLDVSALSSIVAYEPSGARPHGRARRHPLGEIVAALDAHHQMLAFEPPDWGGLLDNPAGQTLGGVLSCNLAGPRRFQGRCRARPLSRLCRGERARRELQGRRARS